MPCPSFYYIPNASPIVNKRLVFVKGRGWKARKDEGKEEGREDYKNLKLLPTTSVPTIETQTLHRQELPGLMTDMDWIIFPHKIITECQELLCISSYSCSDIASISLPTRNHLYCFFRWQKFLWMNLFPWLSLYHLDILFWCLCPTRIP